ncbi:hypothetical protein J2Z49_002493 [Desulfofundulus luciae]|uniref:DUF2088 domain-containing protein n=1 Tax=Desulfofundulus luciae TaxID=74702 RepID=A0ABU0B3T4_9FIRM|nr:hypothetical protein [Desulfofundulus luciae]
MNLVNHLRFVKIRQIFPRPVVPDIRVRVLEEMDRINFREMVRPGQRVAITAGSRGIKNITTILSALVEVVRAAKAEPFVVGAMGSHGGGTAQGQKQVLASLGITGETLGCPVLTAAEVVEIGETPRGIKAFCDVNAWGADGIIVCNRIKPHTTFHGPVESGLMKMMAVGLGKVKGASFIHRVRPEEIASTLIDIGQVFIRSGKVWAGVGIVENSYDDTAIIQAAAPGELLEMEQRLLTEAYRLMPRLPVDRLDFLIVREMGKNISGTGMDTNVIGRTRMIGVPEPHSPFIARIVVLDLTAASHGNATGIGLADITTRRLVEKMDRKTTYLNCITSGNVQRAMLPIVMPDDRSAIEAALASLTAGEAVDHLQGALIKNTLELEYLWVTESLAGELSQRTDIEVVGPPAPLVFREGNLVLEDDH